MKTEPVSPQGERPALRSELLTEHLPNGEVQRTQLVRFDDWSALRFLRGSSDPGALAGAARIYRRFLVPACPWIFGQMLLFSLPEGDTRSLLAAADTLRAGLSLRGGRPAFRSREAEALYRSLEQAGRAETVRGKLPATRVIPVGAESFLLSAAAPEARLKVNASFFILDAFDCATRYDTVGTPFGLAVENGRVLLPPLYEREALFVTRDGRVSVERPSLRELTLRFSGGEIPLGKDAVYFTRPATRRTPPGRGWDHVLVGRRVLDVRPAGGCEVPASGFVLRAGRRLASAGDTLEYGGYEDLLFAVQAGNSLVRGGVVTERFLSPFYNIYRPWRTPYPPSLYPLDYEKARAARIALGADAAGKPMLLWAEGAAKVGYRPGEGGCGVSLSEFAALCRRLGMVSGVNLDGGGSAQLLLDGQRALRISDRTDDGRELERAVPLGLAVY